MPAVSAAPGVRLLLRVLLPDRPGALGLVASRIGALGGDIAGVDVLERGERMAIDEFALVLPDEDLIRLLQREIEEVDGVKVMEQRTVAQFPDPALDALDTAEQLLQAAAGGELEMRLAHCTRDEFAADWAAVMVDGTVRAAQGDAPNDDMLGALAAGTSVSRLVAEGVTGPDDLMVAPMPTCNGVLLVGRDGHPFRRRERRQLLALARIADLIGGRATGPGEPAVPAV